MVLPPSSTPATSLRRPPRCSCLPTPARSSASPFHPAVHGRRQSGPAVRCLESGLLVSLSSTASLVDEGLWSHLFPSSLHRALERAVHLRRR
ncbi:hypothetical protein J5N97_024842 [Dioscorea zingiberensis]|uniref:Uncharacterized protein n=1 Tax=Dioscorea zingiberensis TaxID=325984 RepID=A0A9D5C7Q1_9LILI|nr:hypothetical protein J5N97_024842 [Dioscorea zingiberensis]